MSRVKADALGDWFFDKSCLTDNGGSADLIENGFVLYGADGGVCAGQGHTVEMSVVVPSGSETLSFTWDYQTTDGVGFDLPSYFVDGNDYSLFAGEDYFLQAGSGFVTVGLPIDAMVVGFRIFSTDSCCGPGVLAVTNVFVDGSAVDATTTSTTSTTVPQTIGSPSNLLVTETDTGVYLDWDAPIDGGFPPERYAISFNGSKGGFGIATGNVGGENSLNTHISMSYQILFNAGFSGETFSFRIRSDNDTQGLYSGWSNTVALAVTQLVATTTTSTTRNHHYTSHTRNHPHHVIYPHPGHFTAKDNNHIGNTTEDNIHNGDASFTNTHNSFSKSTIIFGSA